MTSLLSHFQNHLAFSTQKTKKFPRNVENFAASFRLVATCFYRIPFRLHLSPTVETASGLLVASARSFSTLEFAFPSLMLSMKSSEPLLAMLIREFGTR